jgi:protease-4
VKHREAKLTKPIDEMAGGRVYTGAQALELGLVDELGTMDDAVDKAADMASLGDYEIRILPRPKSIFDFFRENMGGQESDSVRVTTAAPSLLTSGSPLVDLALPVLKSLDPQRADVLVQALTRLQLIHSENVILMTPEDWLIRFR